VPIRRRDYHPQWPWISYYIRHYRAKDICEQCGIQNYSYYPKTVRKETTLPIFNQTGVISESFAGKKVILTVAHLDNNPKNNQFDNLACLCQRCHLNLDRATNNQKKKYGRKRQKNQVYLFDSR
jgi:hypothetical protein